MAHFDTENDVKDLNGKTKLQNLKVEAAEEACSHRRKQGSIFQNGVYRKQYLMSPANVLGGTGSCFSHPFLA